MSLGGVSSAVFWGIVVLSVLVFVHEGGHYLAARASGMRVTEFFLGLPCRFRLSWRSRKTGTEYGVTPILLGGYTRICGMEGADDELLAPCLELVQERGRVSASDVASELRVDEERAYRLLASLADLASIEPWYDAQAGERPRQSMWPEHFQTVARDAVMLTAYDRGHDFDAPGFSPAGESRPIQGDPGEFLRAEQARTYEGKGFWPRVATLFAGPLVNLLCAFLVMVLALTICGVSVVRNSNTLGAVEAGSLAERAGLRAGDTLTQIGGEAVTDWASLGTAIDDALSSGDDFQIAYTRGGESHTTTVDVPDDGSATMLGVDAQTETYHPSVLEASRSAVAYGAQVATFAARLIIPTHTVETMQSTSSVVGISTMASQAAQAGPYELALFVAMISMSLGFMNLLPIPPLDGGKILIEIIQAVSRRRVSARAQAIVSYVGLAFFLVLFAFALRNDFVNIILR